MSTNINQGALPDTETLERLANQFFSATGFGVSPQQGFQNGFNINHPPTALPDPHIHNPGKIPSSVAGSGISPSAQNGSTFNIKDPQTSLPDPHNHSYSNLVSPEKSYRLPFEEEQPFEKELTAVLNAMHAFVPQAQLPSGSVTDASYYFLDQKSLSSENFHGLVRPPFDVNLIKQDFPILNQQVNGHSLVWLDNAATTQKPRQVIERISQFYKYENSNIHRAAHELAARSTDAYEGARKKVQLFLNAASVNEIVFVRGATEAINLVAQSWGEQHLKEGDEIIVSYLEHHANIVPWQQLVAKKGVKLRVIPVDDDGQLLLDEYAKLLNNKTKIVAVTQVSNALGTITPVKKITELAHHYGAKVLVDGAQAVSHLRADVRDINCDWYVFSGHKVFGPTGIGVLYGKEALLNETQPWQGGGNMIADVTFENTKYQNAPARFEAGTGNIADAVGLGAAIDYVNSIGIDLINQYEHYLLLYATKLIKEVKGLRLIGTAKDKASVLSFTLEGFKTEEVGAALNKQGIAVRSGHHCAQPILRRFGLESTVRPSLAFYNTCSDVDHLVKVLHHLSASKSKIY
ncbi:MAG: family 2A encapsulin nanocompartment cargo protein cysteine desulfurase [Flavobacteriales bacterium]